MPSFVLYHSIYLYPFFLSLKSIFLSSSLKSDLHKKRMNIIILVLSREEIYNHLPNWETNSKDSMINFLETILFCNNKTGIMILITTRTIMILDRKSSIWRVEKRHSSFHFLKIAELLPWILFAKHDWITFFIFGNYYNIIDDLQ